MRRVKIVVDHEEWTVCLWSEAAMEEMEEDRKATTIMETKRINISQEYVTPGLIIHELIHAHCWKAVRDAKTLDGEEMEEIMCCSIERQWGELLANYEKIKSRFL